MPKTYNDLYLETRRVLGKLKIPGHTLEARIITEFAAGKTREEYLRDRQLYAPDGMEETLLQILRRRLSGEPVAYITGSWEFFGLPITVTRDVLIPRVDTELLAETAISMLAAYTEPRVLDLCAGSGCIGCAIAAKVATARIVMADISPPALDICRVNAERTKVADRVSFIRCDALNPPPSSIGSFDLLVCNPPYIPSEDIAGLDKTVRNFEPSTALDGGPDGLAFYRSITRYWKPAVRHGGFLAFEAGVGQSEQIIRLMRLGGFRGIATRKDTLNIERVITAKA